MGAYSLFRHGASFCGAEYGHRIDVQRTGRRRQAHYLLDITDSTLSSTYKCNFLGADNKQ